MLARSFDGVSIGYDCFGSGPLVLLLHGFGNTRDMWAKTGWTGRLKQDFTMLTMDLLSLAKKLDVERIL
jgi:pimeloyl-ACP methyl ester carboxylesterase